MCTLGDPKQKVVNADGGDLLFPVLKNSTISDLVKL
jgi:hypothetical protein